MKRIQAVSIGFNETRTPFSPIFQDVYYSMKTGIDESIHVYVEGSGFAQSLAKAKHPEHFRVGEIGFGVGLNFLLTYRHFLEHSSPSQKLTYLTVEKFPVKRESLIELYSQYPDNLKQHSDELLERYPVLTPGIHTLTFAEGRVRLILMLGDAQEMFGRISVPPAQKIQHWYWDGFAPSKNPEAFEDRLFKSLIPLSTSDAVASSFTSAGWVRRGLTAAGFRVEKKPGFGTKRESIQVFFPEGDQALWRNPEKPWFSSENLKTLQKADRIAVIGAGLSGTAIARALAERGFAVQLIDQESVAAHASGNPAGLFNVQLSKLPNPISRFSQLSLAHFLREIKKLQLPVRKGILRLDAIPEKESFETALHRSEYPEDFFECRDQGIYFPECGILNPKKLCETRAGHPNIQMLVGEVHSVQKTTQGFHLKDKQDVLIAECDHVVYATGSAQVLQGNLNHPLLKELPLRPIRGQIIEINPTDESASIPHTLVDSGYITPLAPEITDAQTHWVGATYQAKTVLTNQTQIDSQNLLQEARDKHPAFRNVTDSNLRSLRVGYRLSTPDKLPIIGPLCDPAQLKQQYFRALRSGKLEALPPLATKAGEWLFLGMGSRGITFSSYGAELLASLMSGEILPIETDLWEHLHSARFTVRNLKKPEAPGVKLG